ncbi:MAG: phosphatidate cytidylyltransferase [Clostridia bacterium]|nr:phosphatidate cytidylyltransferase [Clostridia bacterium]
MKTRVLTGVAIFIVIIPIFIFFHTFVGPLFLAFLGFMSVYELSGVTGLKSKWPALIPFYLAAVGVPLIVWFDATRGDFFKYCAIIFFLLAFYILAASVFSKGKLNVADASVLFTMSFYAIVSFDSILMLRHAPKGVYLFLLPFVVSWATDIFAYFSGRLFGRHKLIPEVSPKKTVEGAIGGLAAAVAATLLYGLVVGAIGGFTPNYLLLGLAGALMSLASMAGDLIASVVKRHYGAKDYGKLLPGHGGILDRFDSVLAAAPMLIILLELPVNYDIFPG